MKNSVLQANIKICRYNLYDSYNTAVHTAVASFVYKKNIKVLMIMKKLALTLRYVAKH